jgi:hypothetical protein
VRSEKAVPWMRGINESRCYLFLFISGTFHCTELTFESLDVG